MPAVVRHNIESLKRLLRYPKTITQLSTSTGIPVTSLQRILDSLRCVVSDISGARGQTVKGYCLP